MAASSLVKTVLITAKSLAVKDCVVLIDNTLLHTSVAVTVNASVTEKVKVK